MARGVRKSPVEKMQGELADVQASMTIDDLKEMLAGGDVTLSA